MTISNMDSHLAFTCYFFSRETVLLLNSMKLSIETRIRSKVIFDKTVSCTLLYIFICSITYYIHIDFSFLNHLCSLGVHLLYYYMATHKNSYSIGTDSRPFTLSVGLSCMSTSFSQKYI
jgi:hypothetical protein